VRGAISLADALITAARLGAETPAQVAEVVRLLGLQQDHESLRHGVALPVVARSSPVEQAPEPVAPAADKVAGPFEDVVAVLELDVEPPPAWLHTIQPSADVPAPPIDTHTAVPPPLRPSLVRSAMVAVTTRPRPGTRMDVEAVVARAALCRSVEPVPVLPEVRTATTVQLLLDAGEDMEPYPHDVDFLARHITEVAGHGRVHRQTFVDSPRFGVDPDVFSGESLRWQPPGAGSLVIAITDMGCGRGPRRVDPEWSRVDRIVRDHGGLLRVLTPDPPDFVPDELTVIGWDDMTRLVRGHG
jgi:hypothetical protein